MSRSAGFNIGHGEGLTELPLPPCRHHAARGRSGNNPTAFFDNFDNDILAVYDAKLYFSYTV
jgi:hypothetical protein